MKSPEVNADDSKNGDYITNIVISSKSHMIVPTTYHVLCLTLKNK